MKKPNHGGKREGAGRPTADNAKDLKAINVQLDPSSIDEAKKIGQGNVSLGIRRALTRKEGE